jgi:hypothetical protein
LKAIWGGCFQKEEKKGCLFWGYLLFCFTLISWGCLTSPAFFFFFSVAMSQFDWSITKKQKLKLWWLPKIEDSMERWSVSPLIRKGEDFGQNIWD